MAMNVKAQSMFIPGTESIETAANDVFTWIVDKNMMIRDISVIVGEAAVVATSTDPVFSLDITPVGGSRTEKATLSVADGTALGTEVTASESSGVAWAPFMVEEGDILYFEHKTAGAGGSSAGTVNFLLYFDHWPKGDI